MTGRDFGRAADDGRGGPCQDCVRGVLGAFSLVAGVAGITVHSRTGPDVDRSADPARLLQPGLWRAVFARRNAATDIDHRDPAQASGMPVIWRVGPDSTPDNLGRRLEEGGFKYADDALAMAVDLGHFDIERSAPHHPDRSGAGRRRLARVDVGGAKGLGFPLRGRTGVRDAPGDRPRPGTIA